jgi:hypothetical protein
VPCYLLEATPVDLRPRRKTGVKGAVWRRKRNGGNMIPNPHPPNRPYPGRDPERKGGDRAVLNDGLGPETGDTEKERAPMHGVNGVEEKQLAVSERAAPLPMLPCLPPGRVQLVGSGRSMLICGAEEGDEDRRALTRFGFGWGAKGGP